MICTRRNDPETEAPAWLGAPCPDCGHTSLGHPGVTNPTLDGCLVCEVQAAVQQLRDTMTGMGLELVQWQAELVEALAVERARIDRLEAPSMSEGVAE